MGEVAEITLAGELYAGTAPLFEAELDKAVARKPKRLVLFMSKLGFMASIGVREILLAKQKLGKEADIYVIAPQEQILDTIKRTGLERSLIVQSEYKPA